MKRSNKCKLLGKKKNNQTINNRGLDSKVDNTQLSPQQPLYSCFKKNYHLHCSAPETYFSLSISGFHHFGQV